jgi:NAD+ synthase
MFDVKKVKNEIVEWIRNWFEQNGKDCMAVVGISGGVDSSVVTALCVKALGKDRVFGIKMPCGEQPDIEYANMLIKYLEIKSYTMNIWDAVIGIDNQFPTDIEVSKQTTINLPPRIRMAALYAISQSLNGRVVNTCNMSESYVGFDTRYGDSAGDLSPLANLTKTEVIALAKELGLPDELVHKTPQDGLTGLTDEQSFGFSYAELDAYIRDGIEPSEEVKAKIDSMHEKNLFKLQPMPSFVYQA